MKNVKNAVKKVAKVIPAMAKIAKAVKIITAPPAYNVIVGHKAAGKITFTKSENIAKAGMGALVEKLLNSADVHEVIVCLRKPAKAIKTPKAAK
jgi:phytoene dehydrogenase-like protein